MIGIYEHKTETHWQIEEYLVLSLPEPFRFVLVTLSVGGVSLYTIDQFASSYTGCPRSEINLSLLF